MPDIDLERPRAQPPRDLSDPTHARRSRRASLERRLRRSRRDRTRRGGRRAVIAAVAGLAVMTGGAVAADSTGTSSVRQAGFDVAAVQRALGITADGVYGPQTRRAVKRFQRSKGLAVDGVVGPQTLAALGIKAQASTTTPTARSSSASSSRLEAIAQCESGGDPTAVSPDGTYRGKYQFSRATWRQLGGTGDPAAAPEAVQDQMAAKLMATQGPSAWPNCA